MVKKTPLTPEDLAVWQAYTSTVKALSKTRKILIQKSPDIPVSYNAAHKVIQTQNVKPPRARDLKNVHVNARLDLHGLTLDKAHELITGFINQAYAADHRCVLIITGKGTSSPNEWWQEQGVLRLQVPRWLNEEPIKSKITTHAIAKPEHGGAGALYVFIKRRRV